MLAGLFVFVCLALCAVRALGGSLADGNSSFVMDESEGWWLVQPTDEEIFDPIRNQKLYLRFAALDDSEVHSCYEYRLIQSSFGKSRITDSNTFCYPSIIVTGVPKCSTSALYALFHSWPHSVFTESKENCLVRQYKSIISFFLSFPRKTQPGEYLIDGCIDLEDNMRIRKILHNPSTFYILIVRNYADWVWSAYNYWCDVNVDKDCDIRNLWVLPGVHHRSVDRFHDMVVGSMEQNLTIIANTPQYVRDPCEKAYNFFQGYVNTLWRHVDKDATAIVSSEDLETDPEKVWIYLVKRIGLVTSLHPGIAHFTKVRYNTQNQHNRGHREATLWAA